MKRKIKITLISFLCMLMLCSCGTSKVSGLKVKSQGKKNAIEYIENKYGATPRVVKSKVVWGLFASPGCLPEFNSIGPNGDLECIMELNGQKFNLIIEGDTKDYTGWDDYEADLIRESMVADVEDKIGITCTDYFFECKETGANYDGNMVHTKFEDMGSFVKDTRTKLFIATTDPVDPERILDFFNSYSVENEHSLFMMYIFEYDDEVFIPNMKNTKLSELVEDEHLKNFYNVKMCGYESMNKVELNDEVISE